MECTNKSIRYFKSQRMELQSQTKLSEGCHFIFILLHSLIKLLLLSSHHNHTLVLIAVTENRIRKNLNNLARHSVVIWEVQRLGV